MTAKIVFVIMLLMLAAFVPAVSAQGSEFNVKELTFGPGTLDELKKDPNFIAAHGKIPAFSASDDRKKWLEKLDKGYSKANKNFKKEMSKKFYPNGQVIAYGYTIDGVFQVTIEKGKKIDIATENEIYNLFSNYGEEYGLKNIPLVFVYGELPVPTNRISLWRPLIGGIQIISDGNGGAVMSTLGFAAKTSGGTKGFVVAEHAAPFIGSGVYQPYAKRDYYAGSVAQYSKTADASWVPCTNVNARIYEYDSDITQTVKSYGDPILGQYVYKSGISTGRTSGIITQKTTIYNSGLDKNLNNQYIAEFRCSGGDSGSPVYVYVTGGVKILGIQWGGNGIYKIGTGYSSSIFSPVSGIHNDLGVYPLTA